MAITSVGYAGTITDANWRRMATAAVGSLYGVDDATSWKVTPGVGDRAVRIATGGGFGLGVRDVSDAVVTLTLPTVPSGSRWDLIVMHRDWGTKVSQFQSIQGGATEALPARDAGFGTQNDQPIALVRVAAGNTVVQDIIDLRCIPGDGGVFAFHALALSYLDRVGTSVRIGDAVHDRVVNALGNPVWVSTLTADTGWTAVTPGTGWESANGFPLEVRAVGALVQVRGALVAKTASALGANLGTVAQTFRPTRGVFLGAQHGGYSSSGVHVGELLVSQAGLLSIPNGYFDGALGVGAVVPVHGTWFRG